MKLTKILLPVSALFLVACGGNSSSHPTGFSSPEATSIAPAESSQPSADPLSFLSSGKAYFDLNLQSVTIEGFEYRSDENVMETKKAVDFAGSFSFKGTPSDKVNVYYCFLKKDQTDANAFSNIGVRTDAFEALGTRLSERYTNLDKLYVCVTDVQNGWDHSLSAAMNELIGKIN